jgi:hypothetical protein
MALIVDDLDVRTSAARGLWVTMAVSTSIVPERDSR